MMLSCPCVFCMVHDALLWLQKFRPIKLPVFEGPCKKHLFYILIQKEKKLTFLSKVFGFNFVCPVALKFSILKVYWSNDCSFKAR